MHLRKKKIFFTTSLLLSFFRLPKINKCEIFSWVLWEHVKTFVPLTPSLLAPLPWIHNEHSTCRILISISGVHISCLVNNPAWPEQTHGPFVSKLGVREALIFILFHPACYVWAPWGIHVWSGQAVTRVRSLMSVGGLINQSRLSYSLLFTSFPSLSLSSPCSTPSSHHQSAGVEGKWRTISHIFPEISILLFLCELKPFNQTHSRPGL